MRPGRWIAITAAGWLLFTACSLLSATHQIPAPAGCGDCHREEIAANWSLVYRPVDLADETGRVPWRRPGSTAVGGTNGQGLKVEARRCFLCHLAPDAAHRDYSGYYHP